MITVYISIGNSDDKLTQAEWSNFVIDVALAIGDRERARHGDWRSGSDAPWQNACWLIEIDERMAFRLQHVLGRLAVKYRQDSIAWAEATTTFIEPAA